MAMLMLTLMLTLMLRPILTLMLMPMSHIRLKVGGAPGPPLTEVRPHNRPNCCGQPLLTNYCGIFLGKQEIPYKQIREMLSAVGPVRRLFEASSQKMERPVSMEWSLMIHVQYCLYHYMTQICRA